MRVDVIVAHRGIVAACGERVLRQVVGADGEEVDVAGDGGDAQRGGGRLDHRAEGRTFGAGDRLERGVEQRTYLADVLLQRHHRNQDADVLLLREPEKRGELRAYKLGILE
jgi:hypothetical protein